MSVLGERVLRITNTLTIPLSELRFRFARSSGPGGQHVNRSATRVELFFDVASSPSLTEAQRERARPPRPFVANFAIVRRWWNAFGR
jgi:ribosome-associated protein